MHWHISLLLFLASPLAAAADEPALSLDEAVERASESAPQVTAQMESLTARRELAASAGRLPDPALMVGVDNLPVNGPDAFSSTTDFMTMRKLGLMQEFPRREKRRLEHERAAAQADLAGAELARTRLDVAREAARAWIWSAAAESALADLASLQPEVGLAAAAARAGVASGRTSTAEALAAEAAVARLDNRLLGMQGEARRARAELARWIGKSAARPLAPIPAFDRLPAPEQVLLAEHDRHGAILPFQPRLAAARADVALARAERRPDWSAQLAFGKRGPEFSDMVSLQFTIELPLFAKYRQNPVIAARSAEFRRVESEREDAIRMHTAEVRQMQIDWEQSGAQLEQYQRELLPLARERSNAALAGYRAGSSALQLAIEAFEDEIELLVERAALIETRGRAWSFLRYLEPQHLQREAEDIA